jgi:hypothetical protein
LAKTSAKIFEAVSLDGSSANERTPRAFFSETATRGDGDAKRDREESAFRGDERAIEHGVWLSSERQGIVARSRLEKRSRQRKRTRRELRFVSKKRSLGTRKHLSARLRPFAFAERKSLGRKRSTRIGYRSGFFVLFRPRKIPAGAD